jgi:PmbA protein
MSAEQLQSLAEKAIKLAKERGANEADVVAARAREFEVKVADGEIVTLTQATSKGMGLRVFVDGKLGFCTTSDFQPESIEFAVGRAVDMAKETAPDEYNGLVDAGADVIEANDALDLFDPNILELDTETKIAWAHELEKVARSVDPRVNKFRDSGVADSDSHSVLVTSKGAVRRMRSSGIALWCNPIADDNGELQTEYWYDSRTHLSDLESVESVGRTAGERTARMLGAKPIPTQKVPVIFEPHMAAGLVTGMLGALNGDMVYKKASFLSDMLNKSIATSGLSVLDNPLLPRGAASSPFDGEGLPTSCKRVIDKGVLTTFFYDGYTAKKAGVKPTANARRGWSSLPYAGPFNFYVEPGQDDPSEIWKSVDKAFVITRGLGSGVNAVTGEYSRGANGLWIENGEIVHPVQEVTIAGNFLEMLNNIDRIGNDLSMRGSTGAPTLRIAEMTVSGQS